MAKSYHKTIRGTSYDRALPFRLRPELPLMMSGGCISGSPRGSAGRTRIAAPQGGRAWGLLPVDALVSVHERTLGTVKTCVACARGSQPAGLGQPASQPAGQPRCRGSHWGIWGRSHQAARRPAGASQPANGDSQTGQAASPQAQRDSKASERL